MKPEKVEEFEYKGLVVTILDMGKAYGSKHYWWQLENGASDVAGKTIEDAVQRAKHDIDVIGAKRSCQSLGIKPQNVSREIGVDNWYKGIQTQQ